MWSADDGMQIGAMQALENAGLLDKVKFASDGLYPDTVAHLKSGRGNQAIVGETFHSGARRREPGRRFPPPPAVRRLSYLGRERIEQDFEGRR